MAIWTRYFGENKLGFKPDLILDCWNNTINNIKIDLGLLKDNLSRREELLTDYYIYDETKWEIEQGSFLERPYILITYPLYKPEYLKHDRLKVYFYNDVMCLWGPSTHFDGPSTINFDETLTFKYDAIMTNIFKPFGGSKVVFCDEWTFDDEESEYTFARIMDYLEKNPHHKGWRIINI